jgi:hypothetical protein
MKSGGNEIVEVAGVKYGTAQVSAKYYWSYVTYDYFSYIGKICWDAFVQIVN